MSVRMKEVSDVAGVEPLGLNALRVIAKRYAMKSTDGSPVETWDQICRRVVSHVAKVEADPARRARFEDEALALLLERRFIPNTPCLVNAGTAGGQLAACFVLDVPDSIDGILDTTKAAGIIHKTGGGTGFTFEKLRPAGSPVSSTHGVASGPVSFMNIFNTMTETVKQGGVRRGANMGMMRVTHPDILRFIHAKNDQTSLTNFNISVTLTDGFMEAVERGIWFQLEFDGKPWDKPVYDPTANDGKGGDYTFAADQPPRPGMVYAPDVWQRIVFSAWKYGEPGIAFIDEVNRHNHMMDSLGPIYASNPCVTGETMVATPEGPRRADAIRAGDRIRTVAGEGVVERVEVYLDRQVFRVTFSDGTVIRATAAHQFHLATGAPASPEWVPTRLDELRVGSPVRAEGDGVVRIEAIAPDGFATVYDLYEPETDTWITEGIVSRGCGEQFLHFSNACNLGSIDVARYFDPETRDVDRDRLARDVAIAVRFLDNVVDVCAWPLGAVEKMVRSTRPVGLGIMGAADLLLRIGIRYGDPEAVDYLDGLLEFIRRAAWRASLALGSEKGAFPEFQANRSAYERFFADTLGLDLREDSPGPRNYEVTTVAPTGTIALVAETSSGIEPNFSWAYVRNDTLGERTYVHTLAAEALGLRVDQTDADSIRAAARYVVDHAHELPSHFVTAHQVTSGEHLQMLAAAARNVDNSVSKTVNGSADDTADDVDRLYRRAHRMGVKAVSYYRDGTRNDQVLTVLGAAEARGSGAADSPAPAIAPAAVRTARPRELAGATWRIPFDGSNLFVTVNHDGEQVLEVFAAGPISATVGKLASKMLRGGFTAEEVSRTFDEETGTHSVWFNERLCTSPEQAIAECLMITARRLRGEPDSARAPRPAADPSRPRRVSSAREPRCPDCGGTQIDHTSGCETCRDCGRSKCS